MQIENNLGKMLKKALTEEVFNDKEKENCTTLPVFLMILGFISRELAQQLKYFFFMSCFYTTLKDAIHEELYEDYICNMIANDPIFIKRFRCATSEEVYDVLDKNSNPLQINDQWFPFLNRYVPNIVFKDNYLYFVDPEIGITRVGVDNLKMRFHDPNVISKYEKLNGMPDVTDIVGHNEQFLYTRSKTQNRYYAYSFSNNKTLECDGYLHGICNGAPIVNRDGTILALDGKNTIALFNEKDHKCFCVKEDRVIVGCTNSTIENSPFYYDGQDWQTKKISSDEIQILLWRYVVQKLYSTNNKTEDTFHIKFHPSIVHTGAFYGPWQMNPPIFTVENISKKIIDITNNDNRNVQLFIEMLKYIKEYDDGRMLEEQIIDHIIHDKKKKKEGGVFSEEYVEELIQKKVFTPLHHREKMKGNLDKSVHEMNLHPESFEMILSGSKTIELRMYDEKRQKLKIYDDIMFVNDETGDILCATILGIYIFPNFETLFSRLPLLQCGYDEETLLSASPEDMNKYYSQKTRNRYNVVGIEIRLKDKNMVKSEELERFFDCKTEQATLERYRKYYGLSEKSV